MQGNSSRNVALRIDVKIIQTRKLWQHSRKVHCGCIEWGYSVCEIINSKLWSLIKLYNLLYIRLSWDVKLGQGHETCWPWSISVSKHQRLDDEHCTMIVWNMRNNKGICLSVNCFFCLDALSGLWLNNVGPFTNSCSAINLKTIDSNKPLSGWTYSTEQRHGQLQNHCCPDLVPLRCGYIAEYWNVLNGKHRTRNNLEGREWTEK